MIAQVITSNGQIYNYAVYAVGTIFIAAITGWFGYRWGLRSQIEAKKLEVKTAMLPLIEKFIIRANGIREDWFALRPTSIGELLEPTVKLKSLLTGHKRKMLIEAWEGFSKTTPDEFHITQPGEEGEKEEKMRKLFLARLNAVKSVVESL